MARESDGVIYTKANKEIAVASTKSFLGQVVSLISPDWDTATTRVVGVMMGLR